MFVTGHTGFKGSWLSLWLSLLDARVTGYALSPPTDPSNFVLADVRDTLARHVEGDIRDRALLEGELRASRPDVVFHLAAQSVVRTGYDEPVETFSINALGTAVLLDAVRTIGRPCAVVVVSSDKCYANNEVGRPFRETDPLGGDDPYSASKGATELVTASFRRSYLDPGRLADHGIAVATARAGNVIGGGDWTRDGVIADTVRSVLDGRPVVLRNPRAIRPWQHVLEPLSGYLRLADRLLGPDAAAACDAWNFGPSQSDDATVSDLVDRFLEGWGGGTWQDGSDPGQPHEAGVLRLSTEHAERDLGWHPTWRLDEAVGRTAAWYSRVLADPGAAAAACHTDIDAFTNAAVTNAGRRESNRGGNRNIDTTGP